MRTLRLGFSCLPGRGHLYAATALGRRLQSLGHEVTFFSHPVTRAIVKEAGLGFHPITNCQESLDLTKSGRVQNGPDTLRIIAQHVRSIFRHLPDALATARINALLVDQADPAAGTVADLLQIPFITLSFFPPIYLDDEVPPFICDWEAEGGQSDAIRNQRGNSLFIRLVAPILHSVNQQRREWDLKEFQCLNDVFSKLAIVAQLPRFLDLPRSNPPPHLFYTGPFQDSVGRKSLNFPWERLAGERLIYACLGTVRTTDRRIYAMIAEACANFRIQVVLSLGGMDLTPEDLGPLAGDPVIVHYAPQIEILRRACIAIIHGGMNSTLECICCGVPIVAIPITDDQPGVAARIRTRGLGLTIRYRDVTVTALRECVQEVLMNPRYLAAARNFQAQIQNIRGVDQASEIVERALGTGADRS